MSFSPGRDMFGGGKAGKILDPVYGLGLAGGEEVEPNDFIANNRDLQSAHAQEIWKGAKPVAREGAKQMQLLTKDGTGKGVPIIDNLMAAMRTGQATAARGTAADIKRAQGGAGADPSLARIQERTARDTTAGISGIGPRIAAPFVSGNIGQSLGGSAMAQGAFGASANAIAAPFRNQPQQTPTDYGEIGSQLAQAFGGMSFGGGGAPAQPGSGMSPSGTMLVGNSGMLGGRV